MGLLSWFNRSPTQQKQVEAAIKVGSNLYLHTIPGAEDAPAPLQFSMPDSRYRYLIFCFSAMETACAQGMTDPNAVMNECLQFLVTLATTDNVQEFFGGPVDPHVAAKNGATHLQESHNGWSRYVELEKEAGKTSEINELICSIIHATESNLPASQADKQRLGPLALQVYRWLPTMRDAFIELIGQ